jgi:hypothetical protein
MKLWWLLVTQAATIISYTDTTWSTLGNTATQTLDIDGISTLVTLTAASSVGPGNLTFNGDLTFGGFGIDTGPDGIHGASGSAVETFTITLAPVSGSAKYSFDVVTIIGIGANGGDTTMNVGSKTTVVGDGQAAPGVVTDAGIDSIIIDFESTLDGDGVAGAFWQHATITAVPEPSSVILTLMGMGLLLVAMRRRK